MFSFTVNLRIDFRRVFRVEALQLNLRFLKNIQREGVRVALLIHDTADASVDNHLCADAAWLVRAVKRRAVDGNAKFRRLNDGVLLRVDGVAEFGARARLNAEPVAHTLAALAAGFEARRRAVVARRHDALVLHNDAADTPPRTVAACPSGDDVRHFHKSAVPLVHTCVLLHGLFPIISAFAGSVKFFSGGA